MSLHLVTQPVTRIECTVGPEVSSEAMLLTLREVAIETRSIGPRLNTLSVIEVVFPVAYVTLLPIHRLEEAETVRLIILPRSFVSITVRTP